MIVNKFGRIAVGISGGVDSAVSALLLQKKGFDVVGVFMRNWDLVDEHGVCTVESDFCDAQEVCKKLNIPLYEANFVKEYWTGVFQELVRDYENGITPNPDILCNKQIKFNHFIEYASHKLGTDKIATGHYATNVVCMSNSEPISAKLYKARDHKKDQTFFLSQIPQYTLCRTVFPLGNFYKSTVRKIAIENQLEKFARKKESMGICFIGQRNFQNFIEEYIEPKNGHFIDIDTCMIVGEHKGKHSWTVGQRCRIGGSSEPYYVAHKLANEDILVAKGHNHPCLFSDSLIAQNPFWIHSEPESLQSSGVLHCDFRFQHGKPLIGCSVYKLENNSLFVKLMSSLRAITPGQYAVFYKGNECLGSSRICHPGPSKFSLNYAFEVGNNRNQMDTKRTIPFNRGSYERQSSKR